jgi:hypothetical protein
LAGLGLTFKEFNKNLRHTVRDFGVFLEDVKNQEGDGTMHGLVQALDFRYKRKMRPFGVRATKNPVELVLSDGFYAVFHKKWQEHFPDGQILTIDGGTFCKFFMH